MKEKLTIEPLNGIRQLAASSQMHRLATLFDTLDSTTDTNAKVDALAEYFNVADPDDKVWTIALLSHRRPPRVVSYRLLGEWAAEEAELPLWLFEESYRVVGDYAETIALLIPDGNDGQRKNQALTHFMEMMIRLKGQDEELIRKEITEAWRSLPATARFLFNKLITGGLRAGVSQKLMVRALSKSTGIDENTLALRLLGDWNPAQTTYHDLVIADNPEENLSRPYPFFLAYALDVPLAELGEPGEWLAERKWDGIRTQVISRGGNLYIWTRGEELVTDRYPELSVLATTLPEGTVIECELVAWGDDRPMPRQSLQKRIGRKRIPRKLLDEIPVRLIAYDLLESDGQDIRDEPIESRREKLEGIVSAMPTDAPVMLSDLVQFDNWEVLDLERARSRELYCDGLMLKHRLSTYQVGRKRGPWWKWQVDPHSVDAVLLYAHRDRGKRANMYTEFTFAVRNGNALIPFAKAHSGLTNEEYEEITDWIRHNTIERFGPVSAVPPVHVFEIHFDGIAESSRHKSGVAVRFPRIHRWRRDKTPEEAATLESLKKLIPR